MQRADRHDEPRRQPATIIESVSAGVDAFLSKPLNEQQLLETLRQHTGLALNECEGTRSLA